MFKKLFGTDGIRGLYPEEIDSSLAYAVGMAVATTFSLFPEKTNIVIGKDTRESCLELEKALSDGITSMGMNATMIGIVPSGCISYLTERKDFAAGVMISASHSKSDYNGIKIFAANGFKISDELESKIEQLVSISSTLIKTTEFGEKIVDSKASDDYEKFIRQNLPQKISLKIAIDCANGASSQLAKKIFSGNNFSFVFCEPNGKNINEKCGATNVFSLSEFVVKNNFDLGLAFDGDADRLFAVDEKGNIIDGDMLIFALACWLKEKNLLAKNTVATTILSNCALPYFLNKNSISCLQAEVGDKAVVNKMLKENLCFGGEQSGHIVFLDKMKTGDGLFSASMVIKMIEEKKQPASVILGQLKRFPQIQINVPVNKNNKSLILKSEKLAQKILEVENELCGNGRVLIRASGTENVIRVLVEGENDKEIKKLAEVLADLVKQISEEI
ncbi:MAG: phosphoglucosamine mutase [Clostridia bacterium]